MAQQLTAIDFGGLATSKNLLAPSAAGDAARVDPPIKVVSTTTYTLLAADVGSVLVFTNASGCAVTGPNSFPAGYNVGCVQAAAGQVVFAPASGATDLARIGLKSAGLGAGFSILVLDNSGGTAAHYWLQGDMAA